MSTEGGMDRRQFLKRTVETVAGAAALAVIGSGESEALEINGPPDFDKMRMSCSQSYADQKADCESKVTEFEHALKNFKEAPADQRLSAYQVYTESEAHLKEKYPNILKNMFSGK